MFLLIVFLSSLLVVAALGVMAAVSDFRGLQIPNVYSGIIITVFGVCYAVLWLGGREDVFFGLSSHVLAAAVVFLITLIMFMCRAMGAGDSKLATALALWVGLKGLFPFIFYMSVAGGLLALCALGLKKWKPFKAAKPESWVGQVQGGESKVPYGIAIVAGALASFVKIGYLDVDILVSFTGY